MADPASRVVVGDAGHVTVQGLPEPLPARPKRFRPLVRARLVVVLGCPKVARVVVSAQKFGREAALRSVRQHVNLPRLAVGVAGRPGRESQQPVDVWPRNGDRQEGTATAPAQQRLLDRCRRIRRWQPTAHGTYSADGVMS
jgi:hypothetical protein